MSLESLSAKLDQIMAEKENAAKAKAIAKAEREALEKARAERKMQKAERLPHLAKSTVKEPVQVVWALCAQMLRNNPSVSRHELVNACIVAGVATNTAKTQVQSFLKALHGG